MKTFIRILVLLVAVILIFTAGFWLGSKGKSSSPEAMDSETLQAKAETQQKDLASKLPGAKKPEKPAGKAEEGPKPKGEPKTEEAPEQAGSSPKEAPSKAAGKPEAAPAGDTQAGAKPEAAAEVPPTTAPPEEKKKEEAAATPKADAAPPPEAAQSPAPKAEPEKPAAEPRGMTLAEAAPDGKKPAGDGPPPAKVTSEDLGANHLTYSIQAGAFLDRSLAQERLDELKAAQYPAYLVSAWDDKKQLWHTVRVGRYLDIVEARVAARELSRKQRISAFVYGIGSLRYDELQEEAEPGAAPAPTTVAAKEKDQTPKAELP